MTHTTLILTVGGSHQPIVTAIREIQPDYVFFICTGKDPATGRSGSDIQISGVSNCVKANPSDDKPTLPNIPTQTGLTPGQYQIGYTLPANADGKPQHQLTSADDLDQIVADCHRVIIECKARWPEGKVVADYTGGTKSMGAGLILAALEYPDVELKYIAGSRSDLIKVQDGSQYSADAAVERIRHQRQIVPYLGAWQRFAYSEAEAGLRQLSPPKHPELRGQYTRFRELSRAFAAWDNFDHQTASGILENYAPNLPDTYKKAYLNTAKRINDCHTGKGVPSKLLDLYLNAMRRAAQGRYDDAVARAYRLTEWTAQWLLETQCGVKTGDIKPEQLPEGWHIKPNRKGLIQVGLFDAWKLVGQKTRDQAAHFIAEQENYLQTLLEIRNASILTHGFKPVSQEDWQKWQHWFEQHFIPMLLAETARVGIKDLPPQLPTEYGLE